MGTKLQDFTEMSVWQHAQQLCLDAYLDMKNCKDFTFCDQIKRAALSISNNIAEGAERSTSSEFARFLDIAKGSTGEVRSMYLLAVRLGYVKESTGRERCDTCIKISKQLAGFAKYLRNK
jgi:four helix bundle protein